MTSSRRRAHSAPPSHAQGSGCGRRTMEIFLKNYRKVQVTLQFAVCFELRGKFPRPKLTVQVRPARKHGHCTQSRSFRGPSPHRNASSVLKQAHAHASQMPTSKPLEPRAAMQKTGSAPATPSATVQTAFPAMLAVSCRLFLALTEQRASPRRRARMSSTGRFGSSRKRIRQKTLCQTQITCLRSGRGCSRNESTAGL